MTHTKIRATLVATLAAAATVFATALPAASAPAGGGTRLVGATLSIDKPNLTGTELGTMTVTVHLTDPNGIKPAPLGLTDVSGIQCPCAAVSMIDPTGLPKPVSTQTILGFRLTLSLISGDATDGVWSASTPVGAASSGRWALTAVGAGTLHTEDEPFAGPTLYQVDGAALGAFADVTGSNWPVVHINPLPGPVAVGRAWAVSGTVYLSTTHEWVAGVTLGVAHRCSDDYYNNPDQAVTTDSNGRWHLSWPAPAYDISGGCITVTAEFAPSNDVHRGDPGNAVSSAILSLPYTARTAFWTATLAASASHVPTTLSGKLPIATETVTVYLQRHSGTSWMAAGHVTVQYGHKSFVFRVTRAGSYRVRVAGTSDIATGYSGTVTVR